MSRAQKGQSSYSRWAMTPESWEDQTTWPCREPLSSWRKRKAAPGAQALTWPLEQGPWLWGGWPGSPSPALVSRGHKQPHGAPTPGKTPPRPWWSATEQGRFLSVLKHRCAPQHSRCPLSIRTRDHCSLALLRAALPVDNIYYWDTPSPHRTCSLTTPNLEPSPAPLDQPQSHHTSQALCAF